MSPRKQAIVSGLAAPAFAFIAIHRISIDAYWWAAFWAVLALIHAGAFVGSIMAIEDDRKAQIKRNGGKR